MPYNGGTTILQALWMGVPAVVKAGGNFVSRMGASFMTAAGLSEWVAESYADHVRIAAAMAKDPQALLQLKQGMRERLLASPFGTLTDTPAIFENALRQMWLAHCQKFSENV